jgi:hypothetical protein
MPRFHLGQEVETPIGKGIIVKLSMPHNGLYISSNISFATIWFSTSESKSGWVNKEFSLSEIKASLKDQRKEKLLKLKS